MRYHFALLIIVIGIFKASALAQSTLTAKGYTLSFSTDGNSSQPFALNNTGQILVTVGRNTPIAGIYTGGTLQSLGTLPAPYNSTSRGTGLNDLGQACGYSNSSLGNHAFLYSNGMMTDLNLLPGYTTFSQATAINNAGQVVGYATGGAVEHAFLYANGGIKDLGALPGYPTSQANSINNFGTIVGTCLVNYLSPGNQQEAFVDGASGMTTLATLPAPYNAGSAAYAINDKGDIVGESFDASGNGHACLWSNGTVKDLGTLPGFTANAAGMSINNQDQITGISSISSGGSDFFFYSNGVMTNLTSSFQFAFPNWDLGTYGPINNLGQMAVGGFNGNTYQAALLTPVPEPGIAVITSAIAALVMRRSRANGANR